MDTVGPQLIAGLVALDLERQPENIPLPAPVGHGLVHCPEPGPRTFFLRLSVSGNLTPRARPFRMSLWEFVGCLFLLFL